MASKKMIKNSIALLLTINLVFFGFTVAQAPPPEAAPVCPRDLTQIQLCANVLPVGSILNSPAIFPCCNLVMGLSSPVASVCICNAFKVSVLPISVTIDERINEVIRICGVMPTPADFTCAR